MKGTIKPSTLNQNLFEPDLHERVTLHGIRPRFTSRATVHYSSLSPRCRSTGWHIARVSPLNVTSCKDRQDDGLQRHGAADRHEVQRRPQDVDHRVQHHDGHLGDRELHRAGPHLQEEAEDPVQDQHGAHALGHRGSVGETRFLEESPDKHLIGDLSNKHMSVVLCADL